MRLALIGPAYPYRGGIAHYTTMLYWALREREHEALLVSFKRQYPRWLFPGRSDKDPSKNPLEAESAEYWIDSLNPLTWLVAFQRIHRYRPDVIVLQWWTTFWAPVWFVFGVLNRLFSRRPLAIICHNVLPHEGHWWDPWLARVVLCWGTRFVVQSVEEKGRLLTLIPRASVEIVPHPVYDMFVGQRVSKEEARQRLGLPLDVPVLLFFGIVREYKGLMDVLAIIPEVVARLGKVKFVVAGEFWDDTAPYLNVIERLGIGDTVVIEDRYIPNEEVALYFSAADVLIAPYRRVTGSGAVQMARGFGLPVVPREVGKVTRIAAGEEVEDRSCQALVDEIVRLFDEALESPTSSESQGRQTSSWSDLVDSIVGGVG